MGELEKRIHEISVKNCEDYPGIEKCNTFEQLYAIESTLTGVSEACDDWLKFTKHLFKKYNIPESEIVNFYENNH